MEIYSRAYKIYVGIVSTILIGGSLWSASERREFFPFTPFDMYSGSTNSQDLYILKGQCEISDGTILPLSEFDTWRQEMGYFVDLEIDAMDQFPPPEAAISRCKGVISLMLQDPGMQGCMKIWVYRYYWKKFSGPVAYKPDSKELFCEGSRDELQQK